MEYSKMAKETTKRGKESTSHWY